MDLFEQIDELKSVDFRCTSGMWEDFQEGHLWSDFKKELFCWLSDTWIKLESESDPEEAAQLRGRARTIREVLQLPENVIAMIQLNDERRDRNE